MQINLNTGNEINLIKSAGFTVSPPRTIFSDMPLWGYKWELVGLHPSHSAPLSAESGVLLSGIGSVSLFFQEHGVRIWNLLSKPGVPEYFFLYTYSIYISELFLVSLYIKL